MTDHLKAAAATLLDRHLRVIRRRWGAPDLPEVRRLMRASWLNGFTLGAYPGTSELRAIREEALAAIHRSPKKGVS